MLIATLSFSKCEIIQLQRKDSAAKSKKPSARSAQKYCHSRISARLTTQNLNIF